MWQLLLLVLVAIVVVKFLKFYFFWFSKGIPYESYVEYLYRMFVRYSAKPAFDVLTDNAKKYGKIYGSYRGINPSLVIADAEIAKDVLIKQFGRFFKRTFEFTSGDPLWDNILSQLPHDNWKTVRSVMGHTFTSAKMRSIIQKLDKVAKRLGQKLEGIANSKENTLVLQRFLQSYGVDSMAAISFGIELNCIDQPESEFAKHAYSFITPGLTAFLFNFAPHLIKYIPFISVPPKATSRYFGQLGKHIIEEKRKHLDEALRNNTADILDHHLKAQRDDPKSGLSDEVLASQAFLFIIGGLDTTVFTLTYTTYYLATNPDIQEEVYHELKKTMGDRQEVTLDDISAIPLLEACALETLRLMPVSFIIDRICTESTVVAGVPIEKGMVIEFPLPPIHRNPLYFPEPDKFLPHRFLKGHDTSSDTSAFLTFGDGPKNCVGKRLALFNVSVLLSNLLMKMKFEQTEKTPVPITLKNGINFTDMSKDPIYIKLTPR